LFKGLALATDPSDVDLMNLPGLTNITVVQTSGRLQLNLRPTRRNKEGLKPLKKKYKKKKTSGLTGCRAAATAAAAAAFIPALGYILGQQNIVHKTLKDTKKNARWL